MLRPHYESQPDTILLRADDVAGVQTLANSLDLSSYKRATLLVTRKPSALVDSAVLLTLSHRDRMDHELFSSMYTHNYVDPYSLIDVTEVLVTQGPSAGSRLLAPRLFITADDDAGPSNLSHFNLQLLLYR